MKTNMINTNSVIKSICAVVMLLGMNVSVWGAEKTITYTFTDKYWAATSGGSAANWTSITDGSGFESTSSARGVANHGVNGNCTSPRTFRNVSSISVVASSNYSSADGKIAIKIGGTQISNKTISNSSNVTYTYNSSDYASIASLSGNVEILVTKPTDKTVWVKSIAITYTPVASTVTYNAEGGSCETSSETEDEPEAGVELPEVTPSASAAAMGWGFYGWAEDPVDDPTTTAPTIVGKAGDTYYPSSATTLHAVFAKGEYTKVTSTSEITSGGKYLIAGWYDSKVHVMTSTYVHTDDYYMKEKVITESSVGKISAASIIDTWRYIITGTPGSYFIQNVITNKYIDTYYTDWYEHNYDSDDSYTIAFSDGQCSIKNNYASCSFPYLVLFAEGDFGTVDKEWAGMLLYKETKTPKYCSNPSTVRLVASPAAGGSVVFDDNSSAEMDFATADGYIGNITATPNDGYDFVNWVSSDENVAIVDAADDPTTELTATESATITAHFYQKRTISYILTEGGVAGEDGNPTTVTKGEKDGFSAMFTMQAHYKDMTLVSVTMGGSPMTEGSGADYEWEVDGSTAMLTIHHANIDGDIEITVSATHMEYTKYAFSCSELTLTPHLATTGTPIFITSTASKTVRSQDYIEITGNGLTPSTALTFPGLPSEFAIKNADGTAVTTDVNGVISANAYIFYTPDAGDTSDGLDKLTGITASVDGAKPKTVNLTQDIIGRHLPADFVIAGKVGNKWYALPADFSEESTPDPVEIAVNDINNPSLAYTASTNIYNLYGQNSGASGFLYNDGDDDGNPDGEKIKLGMKNNSNKPLFAFASPKNSLKGDGTATVTNNINKQYWWTLKQTNTTTNITNAQDAKYILTSSNNSGTLSIKNSPFVWGTYASGVEELRLIPASDIVFTEAYFVEWGQHGGVIEVDAQGIDATSVTAHLGVNSATTTLSQTLTGGKSRASKYNYTVNFGVGIDFAAAASNGAMLTLEWKNGATVMAMTSLVVPKIIAASSTLSSHGATDGDWSSAEVHVLPGVTLTANAGDFSSNDVLINHLEIYPGATVKVTKGEAESGTLKVKTLVLRNGWTRASGKEYDVARLYITPSTASMAKNAVSDVWYSDWYIDYDQYYPIAVPWKVTLATGLQYRYTKVSPTYGYDKNIRLLYYDGEGRAKGTNGSAGDGANWRFYGAPGGKAMPATLDPSKAYAMTAKRPTGKAFSIIRMIMDVPSADWTTSGEQGHVTVAAVTTHKDTVNVVAYNNDQGNAAEYAKGWNFIANPYMSLYQGQIGYTEGAETVRFVNIPDEKFKEYDQLLTTTAKLKPASGVLIQAPKTGRLIFGTDQRKLSMPSFYSEIQKEQMSEQQAVIVLSNETNEDMMGLLIADKFTEAYETNADLEKLLSDGNTLRTYMRYGDMNMAYVAINEMLAKEWIPVTVRIPADGEYTFSLHEASIAGELEGVYLIDYQNGDMVTNLIEQSYTFSSTAGTINGRFSINAKAGERQTPTGIDAINAGGDINSDKPFKFIYHDKVYIWLNGVIYDTTGKRVK